MLPKVKAFLSKLATAMVAITQVGGGMAYAENAGEGVKLAHARAHFVQQRPKEFLGLDDAGHPVPAYRNDVGELVQGRRWIIDLRTLAKIPDPRDVVTIWEGDSKNIKTTVGIDFLFSQGYSAASVATTGFSFIALSNDTLTETSASTTLSTEIAANGLARVAATYAHTTGTATATLAHTFTCTTAPQAAQKAALFTLVSAGTMNHALSFTQRSLQIGDTLAITFTITLS